MKKREKITADMCDDILDLSQRGLPTDKIGQYVNLCESAVRRVKGVHKALTDDDFEKAIRYCQGNAESPILLWGLEKLNKKMPEKEMQQEQLAIEEPSPDISDLPTEDNKNMDIVRILSNIEKLLQNLCLNQASAVKEQNANYDILFRAVTSLNNSVLAEMRKYRRF